MKLNNNIFMKTGKRDFNIVAHLLLGLSLFVTLMTIITCAIKIHNNKALGSADTSLLVIEIVLDTLILIAGVLTFMKKRYGLIAIILLFVIRMFATVDWTSSVSSYQFGEKMALFVRDFGLFAIAMCFKKSGISGWKSMLASDENVLNNTVSSIRDNKPSLYTEQSERDIDDTSVDVSKPQSLDDIMEPVMKEQKNEVGAMNCSGETDEDRITSGISLESEVQDVQTGDPQQKTKTETHQTMNKQTLRWNYFIVPLIIAFLIVGCFYMISTYKHGNAKNDDSTTFFYLGTEHNNDVVHCNPNCIEGLEYIERTKVFSRDYNESNFCIKCVSPELLRSILDSCRVYKTKKEYSDRITGFYEAFHRFYNNVFFDEQNFREWLENADSSQIKKLHIQMMEHYNIFKGPLGLDAMISHLGWKDPQIINGSNTNDDYSSVPVDVVHTNIISDKDLTRNHTNLTNIYSILLEEKCSDLGNSFDEFASMMSMITNRKRVYDILCKGYEMDSFEEFDKKFYPSTKEHLLKEKERRSIYHLLKEKGVEIGNYETFCLLLCYDDDLRNIYRKGINEGLKLGTYRAFQKRIR